jgi:hypothetical protein
MKSENFNFCSIPDSPEYSFVHIFSLRRSSFARLKYSLPWKYLWTFLENRVSQNMDAVIIKNLDPSFMDYWLPYPDASCILEIDGDLNFGLQSLRKNIKNYSREMKLSKLETCKSTFLALVDSAFIGTSSICPSIL